MAIPKQSDWKFGLGMIGVVAAFGLTWMSVTSVVEDYAARFVYAPGWSHRMDVALGILLAVAVIVFVSLPVSGWRKKSKPMLSMLGVVVLCLGPAFVLWALLTTVVQAGFFALHVGEKVTQSGVVTESSSHLPYRSRVQNVARVAMRDGTKLRLLSHDSFFDKYLHDEIKVNGTCALSDLPEGLPVAVTMRVSSLGYVIENVTSAQPCRRPDPSY